MDNMPDDLNMNSSGMVDSSNKQVNSNNQANQPTDKTSQFWKFHNSDADFKKLSYEEQTYIRNEMFKKTVQANPNDFNKLSPEEFAHVYKKMVYQPPALNNDMNAMRFKSIVNDYENGDRRNYDFLKSQLVYARDSGWLPGVGVRGGVALGGAINQVIDGRKNDPTVLMTNDEDENKIHTYFNTMEAAGFDDSANTLRGIVQMGGFITDFAVGTKGVGGIAGGVKGAQAATKAAELANAARQAEQVMLTAKKAGDSVKFAEASKNFADLSAAASKARMLASDSSNLSKIIQNSDKFQKLYAASKSAFTTRLITGLADVIEGGVVAATYGNVGEFATHVFNNSLNESYLTGIDKTAANMGLNTATDIGVNLLLRNVLGPAAAAFKRVFGKSMPGVNPEALTADELAKEMDNFYQGKYNNDENLSELSSYHKAQLQHSAEIARIQNSLSESKQAPDNYEKLMVVGNTIAPHIAITRNADNTFDIYALKKSNNSKSFIVERNQEASLFDVADRLSLELNSFTGKQTMANPLGSNLVNVHAAWLSNWHSSGTAAGDLIDNLNGKKGSFVPVNNRPWIGMNELAQPTEQGINILKTKLPLTAKELNERMAAGRPLADYSIINQATDNSLDYNSVIISGKIKTMPTDEFMKDSVNNTFIARGEGFDTIQLLDEAGNDAGLVPLNPKNIKFVVPETDGIGRVVASKADFRQAKSIDVNSQLSYNIDKTLNLKEFNMQPGLLTKFGLDTFKPGSLSEKNVSQFIRASIGRSDIPIDIKFADIKTNIESSISIRHENGRLLVVLPKNIATVNGGINTMRSVIAKLGLIKDKLGVSNLTAINDMMKKFGTNADESHPFYKLVSSNPAWTENMLNDILSKEFATKLIKDANGYSVKIGGSVIYGDSLSDIYKQIKPGLIPISHIRKAVTEAGYKLTAKKDGSFEVSAKKTKQSYPNIHEVVKGLGIDTNVLPAKYRPLFIEYTDGDAIKITADNNTLQMNHSDTLKFLNSFDDNTMPDRTVIMDRKMGIGNLIENVNEIIVKDNITKSKYYFDNIDQAKAFYKDFDAKVLKEIAESKGIDISIENGKYTVRDGSGVNKTYNNRSELQAGIGKDFPTSNLDATEMLPGLTDIMKEIPGDIIKSWKKFSNSFHKIPLNDIDQSWEPSKASSAGMAFSNSFNSFLHSLGLLRQKNLINPSIDNLVNRVIKANEMASTNKHSLKNIINSIFTGNIKDGAWTYNNNGKIMPVEYRQAILQHINAMDNPESYAKVKADYPLHESFNQVIDKIHEVFGKRGETGVTGLAGSFNIPFFRYLDNYVSFIKKSGLSNNDIRAILNSGKPVRQIFEELQANKYFKNTSLKEQQLWFEQMRSGEFRETLYDNDILSVMLRYGEAGINKKFTSIPLQQLEQALNSDMINVGSKEAKELITNFYNNMSGLRPAGALESLANFGEAVARKAGKLLGSIFKSKGEYFNSEEYALRGRNWINNVMNLSYSNMLGFRPMAAFKNAISLHSMYGTVFGHDYLNKGIAWLDNSSDGMKKQLIDKLVKHDIVQSLHKRLDVNQLTGPMSRYVDASLKWFKNADDYTRAAAFMSSSNRMVDAIKKLHNGDFGSGDNAKQLFFNYSKLSAFQVTDKAWADKIYVKISNPNMAAHAKLIDLNSLDFKHADLDAAVTAFGQRSIELTLFNYSPWNKPIAFQRGLIGKVFGQLGTFSAGYRNMISHLWRNVPVADKFAFTASFIATNLAIYGALTAMGIKANDFIPFAPGVMGTGPFYDSIEDLLKIASADGRQLPVAGKRLLENYTPVAIKEHTEYNPDSDLFYTRQQLDLNYPKMIPGGLLSHYIDNAMQFFSKGDYIRAMVSLSGSSTPETIYELKANNRVGIVPDLQKAVQGGLETLAGKAKELQPPSLAPMPEYKY